MDAPIQDDNIPTTEHINAIGADGEDMDVVMSSHAAAGEKNKEKEIHFSDCELPQAVLIRLLKSAMPVGTKLSKESVGAISKAAGIFIMYLSAW